MVRLGRRKPPQGLVGVNQRHAEGVGDVLLGERKLERIALGQPDLLRALKHHEQRSDSRR